MLRLINKVSSNEKTYEVTCNVSVVDDKFVIRFWCNTSENFDNEAEIHVYHGLAVAKYENCDVIMCSNAYDNIRAHLTDLLGGVINNLEGKDVADITRWAADIVFEVIKASK